MDFHEHKIDIYECGPISYAHLAIHPGVYFVYVGEPQGEGDFLYIGRSLRSASERINDHLDNDKEKIDCWSREVELKGQGLYFAACEVTSEEDREEIEAALIFALQPRCNDKHRKKYNYRSVVININCEFSGFSIPPVEVERDSTRNPHGNICSCGK